MVLMILLFLPMYGVLIWTYKNPRESLLWGKRGMFKEEPEPTEAAILGMKSRAIIGLVFLTYMLLLGILLIYLEDKVVFL
ncbi:MAG: hypothetical protein ABS942_07225 [Solibacillus sp.]|uniref:hypothetical protein n=1 Tax=unclassified Solibacillus TaxID=2637870 RepID=UPI0031013A33